MESEDRLICSECQKKFASVSTRNRHLRKMHNKQVQEKRLQHICCPLCPEDKRERFGTHNIFIGHLKDVHRVSITESNLNFRTFQEFEAWRAQENREVNYACQRRVKRPGGEEHVYYNCNRSDSRGFKSKCTKRAMKSGGSIRISGICPSRIFAKILKDGMIMVKFVETHVGHEDELRTKRLLKREQAMIVEQLTAGVTNERILQDARKIKDYQLERINLITRGDVGYLIRKFNIDKRRDADDMVATALKVEEWNKEGRNQAFLFKKIGECHHDLNKEDFAVGFMNNIMEKKLKDFKRLICIDGTHGTNRKNWDLTTVLIKDDENMGFPVAFLLSNRLDQVIQEVFFRALREKMEEDIEVEYIMTDDDPKYYNAWTKVMKCEKKPRHLLCSWHVVKNWNIQGRAKLKKKENKLKMKTDLRKILKETNTENFLALTETYFTYLKEEEETDFLNYLLKYYFKSSDRIMMWAHCYRINAGINTNMAIESLNKLLKYNKMNGNRNIRVEKLLDLLEELVDEKMWKRILNSERPNANNYQHKTTVMAHKKAEEMVNLVQSMEFGKFQMKSSTGERFYAISYNELCDEDCRRVYCNACKICIHRYACDCPEYTVKTALGKHIHAVALYERESAERSESVSGLFNTESSEESLYIQEPTNSKIRYQNDLCQYINVKCENNHETSNCVNFDRSREILHEEAVNYIKNLDDESFQEYIGMFRTFKNNLEQKKGNEICKKRKIEKQTYYPNKKFE